MLVRHIPRKNMSLWNLNNSLHLEESLTDMHYPGVVRTDLKLVRRTLQHLYPSLQCQEIRGLGKYLNPEMLIQVRFPIKRNSLIFHFNPPFSGVVTVVDVENSSSKVQEESNLLEKPDCQGKTSHDKI